jgi:predicted DCC family thiol-disulfide oxidoreductase YuxK
MKGDSLMEKELVESHNHPIIFFDGVCNFCNMSVQFIIKRDRKGLFRFASLQSSVAERLLMNFPQAAGLNSIVLIDRGRIFTESTAVLRICKDLDGLWKGFYVLILFPKPLRDAFYRWFAKHRYRLFGKQSACMIPDKNIRDRFLNEN